MTDTLEFKADLTVDETGQITGIAWPFNGIPDRIGDLIEKGAFSGAAVPMPMLWAHDQAEVVGVWEDIAETPEGLSVKGRLLVKEVARAREVHAMVREGAASGLSIGFKTLKSQPRPRGGRTISALDLAEVSIVAVPCHPAARITSAKAAGGTATPNGESQVEQEDLTPAQEQKADPNTPANDAPGLDTKVFAEVQKRLDKLEAKAARPVMTGPKSPIMDADETKNFSDYLRTGEVKALSLGSGTGGILAPETVAKTIIEKVAEFSPVRSVASAIQMSGQLLQLPRLITDVDPAAVAEGAAKTEGEPTFEQIDLKPFEMGIIVPATKALLEDAHIDLSGYLANHIARRFGQVEATWFVTGDGTTQPEGVLTSAEVADNEVATFNAEALIDHFYSIASAYSKQGYWMMNRKTMALIRVMKNSSGEFIWEPALASGQPPTLLGRPVLEAVDMPDPDAGNTPIVFGDFATGYTIADRVNLDILRDEYTGSANGIVKFVARRRVGGRVTLGEALAKLSIEAA